MIEAFRSHILLPFAGVNMLVAFALIAVLLLFTFAVAWVSHGGSALTAAERKAGSGAIRPQSLVGWLLQVGVPCLIPIYCAWNLFSFSAEKVGVLRSRAYTNTAGWKQSWNSTTDFKLAPGATVIDLGVVVDEALQKLAAQGAGKWSVPSASAGHHQAISLAVLEALDPVANVEARWPQVSERQETTLPPWVVESVEKMTLDTIQQRKNIGRIILQYEARQVGGLEAWGSKDALSAELQKCGRKLTRVKEPLLIPVPPLPQVRLIHAEAIGSTTDLLVSFFAQDSVATGATVATAHETVYFVVEGEAEARQESIDIQPGQVVTKKIEHVTGQPKVVEQRLSTEGFGLGPVPVTRPDFSPQMVNLPVGADLPRRWSARLDIDIAQDKRDWTADWGASLPGTYGIQLKDLLNACGKATATPATLPSDQVVVLQAAPGANRGSRTLHGSLVPLHSSAEASLPSQAMLVFSAHPVVPTFRAGVLREPVQPPRPYLSAGPGGPQMAIPFPVSAVDGTDRDLTAATLTSLYLAQKRATNAPTTVPAAPGASAIGYSRMDERMRETAIDRTAASQLCCILVLVALYAGKCILAILSARRS